MMKDKDMIKDFILSNEHDFLDYLLDSGWIMFYFSDSDSIPMSDASLFDN